MNTSVTTDLFKFVKKESANVFCGGHVVFTPEDLVNTILSSVEKINTRKILVLFNVEFIISLIYTYKVDPNNITFYSDQPHKTNMVKKMKINNIITSMETKMMFDVIVGNPPFNSTDTHHTSGYRKQGKNLSKQFFDFALKKSTYFVALIASYSVRTYSKNVAVEYQQQGLYYVQDCSKSFPNITSNPAVFYFDKQNLVPNVIDEMKKTGEVPENNLSNICFIRATHNGLARNQYEHLLKESGDTKVVLTTSVQKYTSDEKLVQRMNDRTFGYWRVVFNKVSDKRGPGKLFIAKPNDLLTQNVGCFTVKSKTEAEKLKEFLETDNIRKKIGSLKVSNANSVAVFKFIKNPLIND